MRLIARHPGFSLVVVLALGLGIGANTAIFSVVNGVLLRPLPYPAADHLVQMWESGRLEGGHYTISPLNFLDWQERSDSLEMSAYRFENVILTGTDEPQRLRGVRVSAGFFGILRSPPARGRGFTTDDDSPGAERVAVISHRMWRDRLGSDPDVLGVVLSLNQESTTIVGVMPFGVSASDPVTFIGAATILMAAALLASYLPARRASRLDPMAALRHE